MNHPTESYRSLWRSTRAFAALPIAVLAFGHEATAGTAAVNLSHTGGSQDWTVPAGITSVSVTLTGAKGGRGSNDGPGEGGNSGTGGRVTGSLAVTPGELLTAHVGGAGQNGSFATNTGGGAGGSYGGARGGHAGGVGGSGGGGGGGGAAILFRGSTVLAAAGGAGGGGGAGGSTEWLFSDNQANRNGLSGYTGGYVSVSSGSSGADRGAGNDGGGGGGGGGGYPRGGAGGSLRKNGNNNTGGNGGSAGENFSSGLTSASASYTAVSGDASIALSFALPATVVGAFDTAATVPYQYSSIDLTGSHALSVTLGHAPTPGEVLTLVNNTGSAAVTGTFTGLAQGSTVTATYGGETYRFTLSYTGGTGNDITLTRSPSSPPVIVPAKATYTGATSVRLDGTVNPNGFNTTVQFEYGTTTSYGTSVPVTLANANGTAAESVSLSLSDLALGTYHYRITATNVEGTTSSSDGVFSIYIPSDGTPDTAFHSAHGSKLTGPQGVVVTDSAVDANGRWFGVGAFAAYGTTTAKGLVCLNPDGTPDTDFHANFGSGFSHSFLVPQNVVLRRNGKILVSGQFDRLNGIVIKNSIASLNPDGTPDTEFNLKLNALGGQFGWGYNSLVEQADGKILGTYNAKVARLNPDGTLDTSFNSPSFYGSAIALQPDGKVLVGGYDGLIRLNANGSADTAFNTALGTNFVRDTGNNSVWVIRVAPDGGIWVGGAFRTFNGQLVPGMLRLNPDGTLDSAVTSSISSALAGNDRIWIMDIHHQPDGKIVAAGGGFWRVSGVFQQGLLRLNADGSPDTAFNTRFRSGANGYVYTLAARPTGELVAGGDFSYVNGRQGARSIAQLVWGGSLSPETQTLSATYGTAIQETAAFTTSQLSGTVSYSISPPLPTGLSLNSATGVVSGTPLVTGFGTTHTITATGSTSGTAASTLTLSVAKAQLTVTANDATRARGQSNPAFGVTISGLVNGDTLSAISGAPSFSCEATTNSSPGNYAITPSRGTLESLYYSFQSFAAGNLTVGKAAQTLDITPLATSVPLKELSNVSLAATSSAGLPVTLSLEPGSAATLSGSVGSYSLTDIGQTGTVTVRASQAGDEDHEAAQDVLVSFDVTKSNQTITFDAPADKTFGDAPFTLSASADSELPVTFTVISGPAQLDGSSITLTGAGTVVVRASQAGNGLYNEAGLNRSITVARAPQAITFGTLGAVTYGDAPVALTATSDSGLAVTYDIVSGPASLSGGTVAPNAAGTVVVRASQAGDDDRLAAEPVERTLIVNRKALTVTGATALNKVADESTAARIVGATLAGLVDGDEVFLFNSEEGTFPQATTGANLAVTTAMTIDGPDADNYTLVQPALTASITEEQTVYTHHEDWRFANFGSYASEGSGADNADPDGDGITNLLEYALGLDPAVPGVIPASLALDGGNLEYTYTRSTGAWENGAVYQIEWSDTLAAGSWSTETVTQQITSTQGALQTVKASIPAGTVGKRFLRLKVEAASGN
jgi:uncharacterized delta-60 repeat protein